MQRETTSPDQSVNEKSTSACPYWDSSWDVEMVPVSSVHPSPENDDIYGAIREDENFEALVESIELNGLADPLLVSQDGYIISGHRRFAALKELGCTEVPVRRMGELVWEETAEWHEILAGYNTQREKSAAMILREALMRAPEELSYHKILEQKRIDDRKRRNSALAVRGAKSIEPISDKRIEFLDAVVRVVNALKPFWPISVRQVHYNLLNDPPLTQITKDRNERWRYRNDDRSYKALSPLLRDARYLGHVRMGAIADETRVSNRFEGYASLSEFLNEEIADFLNGFHLDRQSGQPVHVEVFGEKNTLRPILAPVCEEFNVALTLGRGYAGPSVWTRIENRFLSSGCSTMALIVVSDFDPEGFDLADDAIRSLRHLHEIPIDYFRCAVTKEQIDELNLATDFNPAKTTSSRYKSFVERTGSDKTWEVEALPPAYLQNELRRLITQNLDMDVFRAVEEREAEEIRELAKVRRDLVRAMGLDHGEGGGA